MINFTVQHILIMRLITQFNIPSTNYIHSLLFIASYSSAKKHDIGFYDFVKTTNGVFSFSLQAIIEELIEGKLVDKQTVKLTEKGHNTYYALARALSPFEDYWIRCVKILNRTDGNFQQMHKSLRINISYRKTPLNGPLFPDHEE